jgi:hypothetical protein
MSAQIAKKRSSARTPRTGSGSQQRLPDARILDPANILPVSICPATACNRMQQRLACRDRILAALTEAQRDRGNRCRATFDPLANRPTPEWVLHERLAVLIATNVERLRFGKQPISLQDVFKAEQQATGHSDYSHKYALQCAFLVEEP